MVPLLSITALCPTVSQGMDRLGSELSTIADAEEDFHKSISTLIST